MVLGELGALLPVRDHLLFPLPFQEVKVVGRPGRWRPTGILGVVGVAGTAGEVDDRFDAELLGQEDGLSADLDTILSELFVRMERVAVTTQGADGDALVVELLLELLELWRGAQPLQLQVRVAGVVACPQLERPDSERLDLLDHFVEAEFREQSGEQTYLHGCFSLQTAGGWRR